jgi:hypothetical protein
LYQKEQSINIYNRDFDKNFVFLSLSALQALMCLLFARDKKGQTGTNKDKTKKEIRKMNKYGFDIEELEFDIEDLIERLEKEHGRMLVRIPKMINVAPFVYEFFAIFSDFSLLEAKMVVIPRITRDGFEASVQVHGVYL